jgi:hypothetical protein
MIQTYLAIGATVASIVVAVERLITLIYKLRTPGSK